MRCWFSAVAYPKKNAAQALTTSPMKVSTLGLILVSASQRTMVRSKTAQARPKALVQVMMGIESLNHRILESLKATVSICDDAFGAIVNDPIPRSFNDSIS